MKKIALIALIALLATLMLSACSNNDEPAQPTPPTQFLISSVCAYDASDKWVNPPLNDQPEYFILNSARDLANLPPLTVSRGIEPVIYNADYAKHSVVIVTTVIYGDLRDLDDDGNSLEWFGPEATYTFTADHNLNLVYSHAALTPTPQYPTRAIMQMAFTTDNKIAADTPITITESLKRK